MREAALNRVKLVFSLFDADGNGVLEATDFDLMARRVVDAAPAEAVRQAEDMRRAFTAYWRTLAEQLDTNRDGRLTQEEFVDCVLAPERFTDTVDTFAAALAGLGDPDGDGWVERPLFAGLMSAIGFADENIHRLFDALKPVEDRVAVDTWVSAIKDFYSPEAVGIAGDELVTG